jgi:hypothetical protein
MKTADIQVLGTGTVLPESPMSNVGSGRRLGMAGNWEQWVDAPIGTD